MKAMILAAGEGRRMRPLTDSLPKPMLPVGGRPLVERLIGLLREHGVREVAINLHHQPHALTAHVGDGTRLGVRVVYSLEETALGTAGGVKRMQAFLRDDPFFVLYGDVFTDMSLSALASFHRKRRAALTMALYQPETHGECGVTKLGKDDRILDFVEKPEAGTEPSRWANAGVYVVEPSILRHIPPNRPFDFGADLFPLLLERAVPLFGYISDASVIDIGTRRGYARAQAAAAGQSAARAA